MNLLYFRKTNQRFALSKYRLTISPREEASVYF
jgi:hypothetical protein